MKGLVVLGALLVAACGPPPPVRIRVDPPPEVTAHDDEPPPESPPAESPPPEQPPLEDAPQDDDPLPEEPPPPDEPPPDEPPPDEPPPDEPPPDEPPPDDAVCTAEDLPTPNAGLVEPAGLDGCPDGMARIGELAACMDRWEAFLEEAGAVPFSPFADPTGHDVIARSAPGAVPQGYTSGVSAAAACAAAGKRLCSDVEWTRACRGSATTTYPYGNTREPGVCNDARAIHPAVEYFGTSASWIWSELAHPCINQQQDTVDPTGTNEGCVDDSGRFFDLMGNLHEWIDDPAGTFRGGFYVDTVLNGSGCLYRTTAHNTSHRDYSTGFRCCADRS